MVKDRTPEKLMVNFYQKNISKGKNFVVKYFVDCGLSRATAYRMIDKCKSGSIERRVGSGRVAKIATRKNVQKIDTLFRNKSGCSQRGVARKFNCSQYYISKILRKKTDIKKLKKKRRPKRNPIQLKSMRPKCRMMYNKYKDFEFLMDDESYFTLSNSTLAGNNIYYAANPDECTDEVRYRLEEKFEPKLLVSACISPAGVSPIYIHKSKQAVNQYVYRDILEKTLIPLVNKYYKKNNKIIFWPDLAKAHYANSILEFLKTKKIKIVPKDMNPANLPEARPIENFWGDLARLVYAGNLIAKDLVELESKIRYCYSKMDTEIYLTQIRNVAKKLNKIAREGL